MCRSPCRSPSAHRMRQSDFNFHIFTFFHVHIDYFYSSSHSSSLQQRLFLATIFISLLFDQQKTFGNYVQTILGCQYCDELNGTQSRIASHYVITRSYTLVQASDNPRQKCWDKIDIWERIPLSQHAYHPPLPQSMLHRMRCESSTLIRGAGFVPCTFV